MRFHAEKIRGGSDEGAVQRKRLIRVSSDCDGNNGGLADATTRWIEIDVPNGQWRNNISRRTLSTICARLMPQMKQVDLSVLNRMGLHTGF
jgi:hypothetical protein